MTQEHSIKYLTFRHCYNISWEGLLSIQCFFSNGMRKIIFPRIWWKIQKTLNVICIILSCCLSSLGNLKYVALNEENCSTKNFNILQDFFGWYMKLPWHWGEGRHPRWLPFKADASISVMPVRGRADKGWEFDRTALPGWEGFDVWDFVSGDKLLTTYYDFLTTDYIVIRWSGKGGGILTWSGSGFWHFRRWKCQISTPCLPSTPRT